MAYNEYKQNEIDSLWASEGNGMHYSEFKQHRLDEESDAQMDKREAARERIAAHKESMALLGTGGTYKVVVTDEHIERFLTAWYPGEYPNDSIFNTKSHKDGHTLGELSRKEARHALEYAFNPHIVLKANNDERNGSVEEDD